MLILILIDIFWLLIIGFVWEHDEKDNELFVICHKDIKIGNAWDLYNVLDGDTILNKIPVKPINLYH